jgi:protein TonB
LYIQFSKIQKAEKPDSEPNGIDICMQFTYLNYPAEARRQKIYGQLRMVVSLLPDGSIHNIEVLESSGQRILDDAAIRIVRLAAPFAAFPPELRKDVDQLEIIRTWKFEKGDKLSSQ